MKSKIFGCAFVVALLATSGLRGQQQGGFCTNYGCKWLRFMEAHSTMNYTPPYCIDFIDLMGRKVRNDTGNQGYDPTSLGGTRSVNWNPNGCAKCLVADPTDYIAVDGKPFSDLQSYLGTFGNWGCPPAVPNPGGGVGGVN